MISNVLMNCFRKAEMREGVVRADLLLADLLEISGRLNEAIVVARKVAPIADTMGYHEHLERANDLLTGATLLMDVDKKLRNPVDQDVAFAISTDVEIRKFAQDMAKIEGLPIDRCRSLNAIVLQPATDQRNASSGVNIRDIAGLTPPRSHEHKVPRRSEQDL